MTAREDQEARVRSLIANESAVAAAGVAALRVLCLAAARALPASGVGLSLMTEDGASSPAASSDVTTELVEELQLTLGEGPCIDAWTTRRPVLSPDLTDGALVRWPAYAPAAYSRGVRSVFAFPLQVGAARIGVMDVYRVSTGSLSESSLGQALTFADVATSTLLDDQAEARDGATAGPGDVVELRSELYQAQGMVMIQLGVTLEEAIVRLRAHAYVHDRRLGDVARDVVGRRIVLDRDPPRAAP